MTRTLRVLAGAALVAALCACQPTGNPRCDRYTPALVWADYLGVTIDCTPPFPGEMPNGQRPLGWNDGHGHVYVWPDRIPAQALPKVLMHELGHTATTGTTQAERECNADRWAYRNMAPADRLGVSFVCR